ncbi:MAG: ATP-binding cassette domain-containing protein [Deferrisomatales bacterium]
MHDPTAAAPLLTVRSLRVERAGRLVLHPALLDLRVGEVVWLQGPSGSGKSTLLRALARLVPWSGELALAGRRAAQVPPREWRAQVALLPSPPVPLAETLAEDLLAPWQLRARRGREAPSPETLARELEALGLGGLALDRPTRELSLGQLARVAFLRTVLSGPKVLLLDEPAANLDPASAELLAARAFRHAEAGGAVFAAGHTTPWEGVHRLLRMAHGGLETIDAAI